MSQTRESETPDPLRAALVDGLQSLGIPADPVAIERWLKLASLLDRWSRRINLTGHRGALEIAQRLLLESAALHQALPPAASIADLGSGAGIPGLPLALCRPEVQVLLVDSRERRHFFQRAAIRELGLGNACALHGRAEALEPILCEGVVSQAMAASALALDWMLRWSRAGGWVAIPSQPGIDAGRLSHPQLEPGRLVPYAAPAGPERAVWLARRRVDSERRL